MGRRPFRRRRIVVDLRFQWSLTLHALGIGVVVLAALSAGIFAPLLWQLDGAGAHGPDDIESAIVMVYMHERFWLVAACCFVFATFAALRLSHRIAGPLVRYKRNLRLLAEGRLPPPLRTRPRDYLAEEVQCLNEAVDGVRRRLDAVRAAHRALRRELEAAHGAAAAGAALAAVAAAERRLGESLAGFQETGELDAYEPLPDAPAVVVAFAGRTRAED